MNPRRFQRIVSCAAIIALATTGCHSGMPAQGPAPTGTPAQQLVFSRALNAVLWGIPLVNTDSMRQAFLHQIGARYNDIGFFSQAPDAKFQVPTPNASTHYVYANYNLAGGPVVLEVPPQEGAGLLGSIINAWDEPVADVGPDGDDKGSGAKYLLLPPGYGGPVPDGYLPQRFSTNNGYLLFRSIPDGSTPADVDRANALARRVRLYPLTQAAQPPEQRYIDLYDRPFNGLAPFDDTFFDSLARMVSEEPVQPRDLSVMGELNGIGIDKSHGFHPDADTRAILKKAARQAQSTLADMQRGYSQPWWPGSRWSPPDASGVSSGFTFQTADGVDISARAFFNYSAFAPPKKTGTGSFYLTAYRDDNNELLDGTRSYTVHVPPNVPAAQYWALTVYAAATSAFYPESPVVNLDSYNQELQRNPDGSTDIFVGPNPPDGKRSNWIYAAPGTNWFPIFRFYGPRKPLLDKTWQLPDIKAVS